MPTKNKIPDEWLAEIIRDTEHYYQGEMQQDARSSWLLSTNSALIVLGLGYMGSGLKNNSSLPEFVTSLPLIFLFVSLCFSLIALMPLNWHRLFWGAEKNKHSLLIEEFINAKFHPDKQWSRKSLEMRVFHHYRSHLVRNQKKSRNVVLASIFLLLSLFTMVAIYLCG